MTFEGPDGCGKSTQLRLLAERLRKEGWRVVTTKQPGGTEVGAAIRQVLLHRQYTGKLLAKTESLLFWADRYEHHNTIVKPALAEGCIVLGDRDFDSSWAYQQFGRGISSEWMHAAHELSVGTFLPDKTLLFDGPVQELLRRSLAKNDAVVKTQGAMADESRFEHVDLGFHERVRSGFLQRANNEPLRFSVLDATKRVSDLHEQVYALTQELLASRATGDEVYEVITENEHVIGKATWKEVHKNALPHKTVGVLIFKDETKKEVLVHKRSERVVEPGKLQYSAGGHVQAGETVDEGIRRELQEELFYKQTLPDFPLKRITQYWHYDVPGNVELFHVYEAIYPGPFTHSPKEVAEPPRWMRWDAFVADLKKNPEHYLTAAHLIVRAYRDALNGTPKREYRF